MSTVVTSSNPNNNNNTNTNTNNTNTSSSNAVVPSSTPSCAPYIIPLPPSNPSGSGDSSALRIPPLSFSLVYPGVYRSACPSPRNFTFLAGLSLRSIVYLNADAYPSENAAHFASSGVSVRCFAVEGNHEPFAGLDEQALQLALLFVLDTRNQPLLIHCNKGKHRTGVLIAILRRLAGHSLSSAFAEYRQFLGATFVSRDLDRLCVETHDLRQLKRQLKEQVPEECRPDWIV